MRRRCVTVQRKGKYSRQEIAAAALELRESAGGPTALAFAFITPDYAPHLEEFAEMVRVDGHVIELVGATGAGLTIDGEENEDAGGFALLALGGEEGTFEVAEFNQTKLEESTDLDFWRKLCRAKNPSAWIAFTNPFNFDTERWLAEWNSAWPDIPCVGGLASGSSEGEDVGVFHNGKFFDAVVVAVVGMRVMSVVSQGCRPIGEPLTVTRAESNVVYSLGARPAYEALESAFEGLTEGEKAGAKGNLFAGLAGTEYVEEFKPGDFLIRNILGADPNSGAVAIGGFPRVGQTLQVPTSGQERGGCGVARGAADSGCRVRQSPACFAALRVHRTRISLIRQQGSRRRLARGDSRSSRQRRFLLQWRNRPARRSELYS